jgi:4-methylaminobutanoate oxidase (formaldehyde-forming)
VPADLIADVAVVGAGALGLSTALHCALAGRLVVVLDRREPGSQASGRAAGLFKSVQADELRTFLARRSIERVRSFPDWAGVPLDVATSGSLLVARRPGHQALLAAEAGQSRGWGVELAEISPGEAAERTAGYYHPAGDEHVVWCPEDVYIEEPGWLVAAYLAACQRLGVQVLAGEEVTAVRLDGGQVTGLEATGRMVRTAAVVDAAGAWVRQVGELAGAWVAAAPVRHQLLVTEPLPDVAPSAPITRILDSAVYLRPARGGLMIGGFEADPLPVDPRGQPPGFDTDAVPLDLGVLRRMADQVAGLVPGGRAPRRAVHDEPGRPVPGRAGARGTRAVGGQRLQRLRFLLIPGARRSAGQVDHRRYRAGRAGRAGPVPLRPPARPGPDRAGLLAVRALLRPAGRELTHCGQACIVTS